MGKRAVSAGSYKHMDKRIHIQTHTHTRMHTQCTCTRTCAHVYTYVHTCARTHMCANPCTRMCSAHTYMCTCVHTHTPSNTRRTQPRCSQWFSLGNRIIRDWFFLLMRFWIFYDIHDSKTLCVLAVFKEMLIYG